MERILLKRATQEDFKRVLEMESIASSKTYFSRLNEQEVKDYINDSVVYFIEKGGVAVGTISYEMKNPGYANINGLIIKPQYHKQGLSKEALKIILDELKDKKRVDLTVHPHNNSAITLYLSHKFIIESWKDNYYGDNEPRLILVYQK